MALNNNDRATVSSGDIAANAQIARDDSASVVNPTTGQEILAPDGRIQPATTASATNADQPKTIANGDVDIGTNAPTKTIQNTQSIPGESFPNVAQQPVRNPSATVAIDTASASRQPGVGAPSDDQRTITGQGTAGVVRNRIDELYGDRNSAIVSQDNILDQFFNYTYSLSWYILTPETYNSLIKGGKKDLNGMYLLAQSGGAPISQQVAGSGVNPTGVSSTGVYGRSPFFNLDYYIDNLELDTAYSSSTASGGASQLKSVKFTLTEPNGITLLRNLYNACNDILGTSALGNGPNNYGYSTIMYCIIIRFYGYDEQGNLVQPIARTVPNTDKSAAIEKFVPFIISDIKFSVGNKLVEYAITGASPETLTANSSIRGVVPQDFQFYGTTVKDILLGANQQQTSSQEAGDETRNGVPVAPLPPQNSAVNDQLNTSSIIGQ